MTRRNIVAIDLGASSGRVMLASWDAAQRQLALREVGALKISASVVPVMTAGI